MKIREKRKVLQLLQKENLGDILATIAQEPATGVINALFAGICHADQNIRWHAIMAMGPTVARLADQEMEAARVIMRRFMWSLNDESGGIGWGAPESMAEIMVCHRQLAREYAHILVSFMREDGFYLEYPPLQRGLMWAIGRLAAFRKNLLLEKKAGFYILPYLDAEDGTVQGLAIHAAGLLGQDIPVDRLEKLKQSQRQAIIYQPDIDQIITTTVGNQATNL